MLKVVIVDSGINKTHKIFKKSNVSIRSLQYDSGKFICSNKNSDLFGHGTAIAGIISCGNPDIDIDIGQVPKQQMFLIINFILLQIKI